MKSGSCRANDAKVVLLKQLLYSLRVVKVITITAAVSSGNQQLRNMVADATLHHRKILLVFNPFYKYVQ